MLYQIESEAAELGHQARPAWRQQHAVPALQALHDWLRELHPKVVGDSGTATTISVRMTSRILITAYRRYCATPDVVELPANCPNCARSAAAVARMLSFSTDPGLAMKINSVLQAHTDAINCVRFLPSTQQTQATHTKHDDQAFVGAASSSFQFTPTKRLLDLFSAVVVLLLLAPLLLVIAALIKLDDGGPVMVLQQRLGQGRRPFTIIKFRSMADGQITRVGRWLRVTGVDELPQLFNVLRGEMSVVGPRPLTEQDVTRLRWDRPMADRRFDVRPGITGLAQLYAGVSARRSLACDRIYGRRAALVLDLAIIGWSIAVALVGKRRVRGWMRVWCRRDRKPARATASTANVRVYPIRG